VISNKANMLPAKPIPQPAQAGRKIKNPHRISGAGFLFCLNELAPV